MLAPFQIKKIMLTHKTLLRLGFKRNTHTKKNAIELVREYKGNRMLVMEVEKRKLKVKAYNFKRFKMAQMPTSNIFNFSLPMERFTETTFAQLLEKTHQKMKLNETNPELN